MALSAEEVTLYTQRLTEAQTAYHNLTVGGHARVVVDQNGERVEFTAPNAQRLRAYIMELQVLLGKVTVTGPMKVWMK